MSSEFLPEILETILSNLQRTDLLNARLVRRSWNKNCLNVLHKSKFVQQLSEECIENYVQFVKETTAEFVLPFHINFVNNGEEYDNEEKSVEKLKKLMEGVEELNQIFGSSCIRSVRIGFPRRLASNFVKLLADLLSKILGGLESLEFNHIANLNHFDLRFDEILKESLPVFPKVKNLSINRDQTEGVITDFCQILFEKCPTLIDVYLNIKNYREWLIQFTGLKSFKAFNFSDELLLKSIQFSNPSPSILTSLGLSSSVFRSNNELHYQDQTEKILATFSSSLKNLELKFNISDDNIYMNYNTPVLIPFPSLPRLKSLSLTTTYKNPVFIHSDGLPVLERISISHTLNLRSMLANFFPNVTLLTLIVSAPEYFTNSASFQQHVENVLNIFPNVIKLCVLNDQSNDTTLNGEGKIIRPLLKGLIQSEGVRQIQGFTMEGWKKNYFGEILHQIKHPPRIRIENVLRDEFSERLIQNLLQDLTGSKQLQLSGNDADNLVVEGFVDIRSEVLNRMTGLEKISLVTKFKSNYSIKNIKLDPGPDEKYGEIQGLRQSRKRELCIDAMVENLPQLQEIEISAIMFGNDIGIREATIRETYLKFPSIRINVM